MMFSRGMSGFRVATTLLLALALGASFGSTIVPSVEQAALKGDWAKVRQELTARAHGSDDPVSSLLAGYAGLATGEYQLATKSFLSLAGPQATTQLLMWTAMLVEQNPANATAQMLLGDALAREGRYDVALASLDRAIGIDAKSALLYDVRGTVKALADDPIGASTDYESALELEPVLADALVGLGIVRLTQGDAVGALDCLDRAVAVSPNSPLAHNARAVVFSDMGLWDQSEADFRKAQELAPGLPFVAGNLQASAWSRAQKQFRASLTEADSGEGRGTTLLASCDRYSVDIGDGRTVDVFSIRNTPQTTTIEGMERTLRQISDQVRGEAKLGPDWKPNVLLVQPGLGSSIEKERLNAARMAFHGGKDFVVSVDMTDKFKWAPSAVMHIDEAATRRFVNAVVGLNRVCGRAPDAVVESQASRFLLASVGVTGSETPVDLFQQGRLPTEFKLGRVVPIGVPFPTERLKVNDAFLKDRTAGVMAITTQRGNDPLSHFGFIAAEPIPGVPNVGVSQRNGTAPSHGSLFAHRWQDNQVNPVPEFVGQYVRGVEASAIQKHADDIGTGVPWYRSYTDEPKTVALTMATMTRRGLTDPAGEAVLIGCKDRQLADQMKAQFGPGWRVGAVAETDPVRLQELARAGAYSRVNIVADRTGSPDIDVIKPNLPEPERYRPPVVVPVALPEIRALAHNLDRFNDVAGLMYKLADKPMPGEMKIPLEFAPAIVQDMHSAARGTFSPVTSQSLERIGRFGMKELPVIVDALKEQGKLAESFKLPAVTAGLPDFVAGAASQTGRRALVPDVGEVTHYLDAVNKTCWASVGGMLAGPKGAAVASTAAGLVADIGREVTQPLFNRWACTPVRSQMVESWRNVLDKSVASGVPAKSLDEMFGADFVRQVGFDNGTVVECRNAAQAINTLHLNRGATKLPEPEAPFVPVISSPRQDEVWKKVGPFFPPDRFGTAGITPSTYRLPSTAVPGEKVGGVAMKADVVKGEKADMTGMFGGSGAKMTTTTPQQQGLVCPFLLFCALQLETGLEK